MHRHTGLYHRLLTSWREEGAAIVAIDAAFLIPEMPAGTFRQRADIACSSLYDIGCYAISLLADLGLPLQALKLKQEIAARVDIDPALLPYRASVVQRLKDERAAGRQIILATGTPRKFAEAIAAHLGVFDRVMATDGLHNLTSERKRVVLCEAFGDGGFDYVGNSRHDLKVFDAAREAIVVAPDRQAARWQTAHRAELVETPRPTLKTILKMLRVHQWLKKQEGARDWPPDDPRSVIAWFCIQIGAKISRALFSRADAEEWDEDPGFHDDDGSAKVALIGIERSHAAWLRLAEQGVNTFAFIKDLVWLGEALEREFPRARAFVRPGFDEPEAVARLRASQGQR